MSYYHTHTNQTSQTAIQGTGRLGLLVYVPFGELFIEERTTWNTPYKFSGKELDEETGYSYFGARYYDPNISIWLSVDPLSDKYPSHSPYNYTMNNPVMLIDPNGMNVDDFYFNKDGKLDSYVENDQPDRVFVATGEVTVDPNDPNMTPTPEYEQVVMSGDEVEQRMNENGYKKVIESQTVEYTEMTTYYTDSDGGNSETSHNKTVDKVLDQETMYVPAPQKLVSIKTSPLLTIDRKHNGSVLIERGVEMRDYNYGNMQNGGNQSIRDKAILFGFKILNAFQK